MPRLLRGAIPKELQNGMMEIASEELDLPNLLPRAAFAVPWEGAAGAGQLSARCKAFPDHEMA